MSPSRLKLLSGYLLIPLFVAMTIGLVALVPHGHTPDAQTVAQLLPTETALPPTPEPTATTVPPTEPPVPTEVPTNTPEPTQTEEPTLVPEPSPTDVPTEVPAPGEPTATAISPDVFTVGDVQFSLDGAGGSYSFLVITGGGKLGEPLGLEVWVLGGITEVPMVEIEANPSLSLDGTSWGSRMIVTDPTFIETKDGVTRYQLPGVYLSPDLAPGEVVTLRAWVSGLPGLPADELQYTLTVVGVGDLPVQPTIAPAD